MPLAKGFYIFEFISQEDRDLIFRNGPYFMGAQGLYLNRWTPNFDPALEIPKDVPVWVRLPNLPIHCWNSASLQAIGNGLGHYIDKADPKDQYSCARICVEVDLEVGLPEAVNLKVGEWQHLQKLDYEQLPFKCRGCHDYGHFQRNCPKARRRKKGRRDGNNPGKEERNPRPYERHPTPVPKHSRTQGNTNSFKDLETEGETAPSINSGQGEEGRGQKQRNRRNLMHLEARRVGGLKALRKKKAHHKGIEADQGMKKARSHQEMKQKGQVKLGTPQNGLAEGGSPKRRKERKETYKEYSQRCPANPRAGLRWRQTRKQAKVSQGGRPPPAK
jgi:hypothetical protein